ncbi:MAG: hypothetical protein S0880_35015 [Actinomycetota bacterium]|nr:hypothetical protein [Actinomycetota bacterium]
MQRHGFRPSTFALSVLFGAFAAVYLLGEATGLVADAELALTVSLMSAGTAGMVAVVAKALVGDRSGPGRRRATAPAMAAAPDPEQELEDAVDIDALLSEDWRSIDELVDESATTADRGRNAAVEGTDPS